MLKEIHEQPARLQDTVSIDWRSDHCFGTNTQALLSQVEAVQIIACGTSYHAGLIARHWIESVAGLSCQVEVASEYRYRQSVTLPGTLVVCISQSGETADTLAALKHASNDHVVARLALCNVDHSAIVRASDLTILTRAGAEIGVASTKAFTTQLAALMLLVGKLAEIKKRADFKRDELDAALVSLPAAVKAVLAAEEAIKSMAIHFASKHHALFLGRGINNPVAMEGALKLKEISYIHAEAYAAGELKHGPLALVDADMPLWRWPLITNCWKNSDLIWKRLELAVVSCLCLPTRRQVLRQGRDSTYCKYLTARNGRYPSFIRSCCSFWPTMSRLLKAPMLISLEILLSR